MPNVLLPLPPHPYTAEGNLRRVGVELEMQGLELETLAAEVAAHVNGSAEPLSRYEQQITGDPAGDWLVELDFAYLKELGRQERGGEGVRAHIDEAAEDLLAAGSQALVPTEVVSPPLPLDRLDELEELIRRLRDAGARGTRDGLVFAFGVHLNPELPDTGADTIAAYLKAFLCLFEWLRMRARVDLLRRLTVYIDPFPQNYVRKVIDPAYWPDTATLIDDYLIDNPTRNRVMDMLPLFAHLDEARVRASVDDPRIKARPTLHYRLPNCEINEPGWGLKQIWGDWLQVEYLASDRQRLQGLCGEYGAFLDRPLSRLTEDWADQVVPWLIDPDDH